MTLAERIAELIAAHGSLREVGRVIGIDPGYLSRLAAGDKVAPSKEYLTRMGLRRIVDYRRLKPSSDATHSGEQESALREATLEEAAKACESLNFGNDASAIGAKYECAIAIRALAASPSEPNTPASAARLNPERNPE